MGSNSKTMQCKVCPLLVLLLATSLSGLNVPGYPYLIPRSPTSYLIPSNFLSSSLPAAVTVTSSVAGTVPSVPLTHSVAPAAVSPLWAVLRTARVARDQLRILKVLPHLPVWHHQVLLPASLASFLSFTMEFSIRDAPSSSMDWLVCTASLHSGALPRWM